MSLKHIKVDRLLEAAKASSSETETGTMPAHLQTRILAHWPAKSASDDWFLSLALRRGLLCAGLIMMICLAWASTDLLSSDDSELAIASLPDQEDLMP
jgi:hypothetical protein